MAFFALEDSKNRPLYAMKFFVCLKQVPDVASNVDTGRMVLNAYDASALEQALVITESHGGEIELVLIGPDSASEAIRKALAMGADSANHIRVDPNSQMDSDGASRILADFFAQRKFDVIACGKQSQDTDAGLTGAMLAERLGLPYTTNAVDLQVSKTGLTARRQGDEGEEIIDMPTPCLVTCSNDMNDPRIPSLRGIMQAKKKSITLLEPGPQPAPRTRVEGYEELPGRAAAAMIEGEPGEQAATLVEKLRNESGVI